jgi:hypothetical protein
VSKRTAVDSAEQWWIKLLIRFSAVARGQWTRPQGLGAADVEAFLNEPVVARRLPDAAVCDRRRCGRFGGWDIYLNIA